MLNTIQSAFSKQLAKFRAYWRYLPSKNPLVSMRLVRWSRQEENAPVQTEITARTLAGRLPVRVQLEKDRVVWWARQETEFVEPFFDTTVINRIMSRGNLPPVITDVQGLHAVTGKETVQSHLYPTGFIFHVSRCGSTLVSNILSSSPRNWVIAEPRPINNLLLSLHQVDEVDRVRLVRGLIKSLGQATLASEENYFIKFSSWNVLLLPLIRQAFPDVPWVFLYRHPVEVMVSNIKDAGGWVRLQNNKTFTDLVPSFVDMDAEAVADMNAQVYAASVLASYCDLARQEAGPNTLFLNYDQLSEESLRVMLDFFQFQADEDEISSMMTRLGVYSKDAKAKRQYSENDSAAKQESASEEVKAAAEQWAMASYHAAQ